MAVSTLSEHACFGGVQGFYQHDSAVIGLPMLFGVYVPPQVIYVPPRPVYHAYPSHYHGHKHGHKHWKHHHQDRGHGHGHGRWDDRHDRHDRDHHAHRGGGHRPDLHMGNRR